MTQFKPKEADEILSKMVDLFKTKELAQKCKIAYIKNLDKPSNGWSLNNNILQMIQGTQDARSIPAWRKVGRYPSGNWKKIWIIGPIIKNFKVKDSNDEESTQSKLVGFKWQFKLAVENTFGKDLEEFKPKELPPLANVAKKWGTKISYAASRIGEYGYISLKKNEIVLCSEEAGVYFHELAHKADDQLRTLKKGQNPIDEAVAELAATVLSELYGFTDYKYEAWNYLASYAENKTPEEVGKLCFKVLSRVQKVLHLILFVAQEEKIGAAA